MDDGFPYGPGTSSRSTSSSPKNTSICLVCTDTSDGLHFGIFACRACTAFFRRTIVLDKKYVCRKGGENCKIDKVVGRAMCRKCRLRKCIELGMIEEMVQRKRDPIGSKTLEGNPLSAVSLNNRTESSSDSFASNSVESSRTPDERPEMLIRIQANYHDHCNQQKVKEMALKQQSPSKVFPGCALLPDMNRITCRFMFQMSRELRGNLRQFLSVTFDEFNMLTGEEQTIVASHCVAVMWVMDSAYRTFCRLPKTQFQKKGLYTHTTYVDIDQLDDFVSDLPKSQFFRSNMISVAKTSFAGDRNRVVCEMSKVHITELEYCALIALTIWNTNMKNVTRGIELAAKSLRRRINQEFHILYTQKGLYNYATRMGEIHGLIDTVLYAERQLQMDIELYNIYNAFTEDNDMYDFHHLKNICDSILKDK